MNEQLTLPLNCNSPITGSSHLNHYRQVLDDLVRFEVEINNALSYSEGTHTFNDIVLMVMNNRVQFHPLKHSFIITEFTVYPQTRHLNWFLAGGDMDEILAAQKGFRKVAREAGCSAMVMTGRVGWKRVLEKQGWRHSHTTMIYEVKEDE